MKPHTVSLIGCGRIAKVHVEALRRIPELSLISVCDIHEGRLKAFSEAHGVPGFRSHAELLKSQKPDLVVIATPNGTHFRIARDCFEKGLNVLLEKPITLTNAEAEDLIWTAKKKKVYFFAVKQVRYNPTVQVLKSSIDEKRLGKLFSASLVVRWTRPQEYFDDSDWRGTKALDGGGLLNQGIHYVDIMQWLVGDVASVFGRTERVCHKIEIEDLAYGLVRFQSGALGSIEFTINTFPHNLECSLVLLGDRGSVKLAGSAMNEIEFWEVKDFPRPVVPPGFAPYVYAEGMYQGSCPNHLFVYKDIVNVFHGKSTGAVDGDEALRSLRIVNALYESAQTGKEVEIAAFNLKK